jgi:hypothetical protein
MRLRRLGQGTLVSPADEKALKMNLPFASK